LQSQWSTSARRDLIRVYAFLKDVNPRAAKQIVSNLNLAAKNLCMHPNMGHRLEDYSSQNIRALIAGDYEIRYEVLGEIIYIIRVWHTREDR
jgi:plasmid stabilization system protein ParE